MPGLTKQTASEIKFTLRDHPFEYFHLQLVTSTPASSKSQQSTLDEISLRQYLTSALMQSFGITGSAAAIDILKAHDREAWIRVQSQDGDLVDASLGQWSGKNVSLRVMGRASWLGGLERETGKTAKNMFTLEP